jgi:hypothetical protein
MARAYSLDLRERVVAAVGSGQSCRIGHGCGSCRSWPRACPREGGGLVDEDKPPRIDPRLTRLPPLTPPGDVRTVLFGGAKALWNGPPLLPAMYARRHFQEEEWE